MRLTDTDAYERLSQILPRDRPLTLIDGGACVGIVSRRLAALFPTATIYAFEPVGANFDALTANTGTLPNVRPIRAALGDTNAPIEILVNADAGTSSPLAPGAPLKKYHGPKVALARREAAPCVRLDDWAAREGVERVDAIKLDLQGYELAALRGADRLLRESVRAVYSEAQLIPLYEGAATFAEIDLFLRERGFLLHQIVEIFRQEDGQFTCCDGLWTRQPVR